MFTESAALYDRIYSFKDYPREAAETTALIRAKLPAAKTILDVGCGTSEHHRFLKNDFSIDGIDLGEEFIRISQEKNPSGNYFVRDMTDFDLGKKYDVVICLFSSIGYLQSFDAIVSALRSFHRHLCENGLVIVEPWLTPEQFGIGKTGMLNVDQPDIKICRMSHSYRENEFSILEFHYMTGTQEDGVRYFSESHKLRLTPVAEMTEAFQQAGFTVSFEEQGLTGRGLFFATRK